MSADYPYAYVSYGVLSSHRLATIREHVVVALCRLVGPTTVRMCGRVPLCQLLDCVTIRPLNDDSAAGKLLIPQGCLLNRTFPGGCLRLDVFG